MKGPIARAGALRLANVSIASKDGGTVDDQATLVARPVLTAGKISPEGECDLPVVDRSHRHGFV